MDKKLQAAIAADLTDFRLPRYNQLPDMGLYLEQTTKYINQCLKPLGCIEITSSMIRNYVKMGLVKNPVQKMYYADQIAHLIPIAIMKQVLPLEYFKHLFARQRQIYKDETAFNYFCMEMENVLFQRCGLKDTMENIGETDSAEKEITRSAITAVSHIIFIHACMKHMPPPSARQIV